MNNYEKLSTAFWNQMGSKANMALATSLNDQVTVRTMAVAIEGGRLFMLTSDQSSKYPQIRQNPNVALCVGATQITGTASLPGRPLDAANAPLAAAYKAIYPEYADSLSVPDYVIVEVAPQKAAFSIEDGEDAGAYVLDFTDWTASKVG